MATPQSGQPIQAGSADQLATLQQLLGTLFGQQQSVTTSANTAPMQQLLAQLQGADYSQLLNSIFAQAGGAIPGLQAAYTNAVGARSGGNSAVQANLERLMQQTALLGQQQVAQQQNANQQIQANLAGNIANSTRTQTTATPGMAGELAGTLALVQGALKLTGSKDLEELWKKVGGGSAAAGATGAGATTAAAAPLMQSPVSATYGALDPGTANAFSLSPYGEPLTSGIPPQFSSQPSFDFGVDFGAGSGFGGFGSGGNAFSLDPFQQPFDPGMGFDFGAPEWAINF